MNNILCIMPASKRSSEFKEHIVVEVLEGIRLIVEVAKSYGLVPQTLSKWVNGRRKDYPDPNKEGVSPDRIAENKRLKAKLWEARMEIEFLKKRRLCSCRNPGGGEVCLYSLRGKQD